ncbi:competence protein ComK [Lederbergia sp. NSJ-179]|uniref:competence protein ComK n=1 Tax=Lederbergia sp. NSJ-179 TaxID=2931402 RepID=UPI001FD3AECE|nr:competence protein ComK [Lederbergia sp. NSJ-179]MCJ7840690.1 competence protein ComK [Lederbergia sp. NSJ-179]
MNQVVDQNFEIRQDYIIRTFTAGLLPRTNHHGYLFTQVVEEGRYLYVRKTPLEIMEESLLHYGHDLDGATKAAKQALGNIDMPPIKVCKGMYWFPTISPKKEDNIWIAAHHAGNYKPGSGNKTSLFIGEKQMITIKLSPRAYANKLNNTRNLEEIFERRYKEKSKDILAQTDYQIIKEHHHPGYHYVLVE